MIALKIVVESLSDVNKYKWSLEIIMNVYDVGSQLNEDDNVIRPTLSYDNLGNKVRNIEEEKRYYNILASAAVDYIKIKETQYDAQFVKYLERQNSEESSSGYIFFNVNEGVYSVDLRVAEIKYTDKTNNNREMIAQRKLARYKAQGIISNDSTLVLENIIISTEDGRRKFEDYLSAIEYVKFKIDELLKELLPAYLFEH